jgi:putative flippase GtrA
MIAKLLRRFQRLIRYGLVGIGVSLLYTMLTVLFHKSGLIGDPTLASAAAALISIPLSFLAHRHTTYADVARHPAQAWRFAAIGISSFIIATGAMKLVDLNHWSFWIGLTLTWFLIPAANYIINALWIFRVRGFLTLDAERSRHDR